MSTSLEPRLVVVIPTKDRRALLERCLGSVFAQDYPAYRVVVVNDGSKDDTSAYLAEAARDRVRVIEHSAPRGVNAARNRAYRILEEGEWAVPLDDDDLLLPGALQMIARRIQATPSAYRVLCFNTLIRTRAGLTDGGRRFAPGEDHYDPSYHALVTGEGLRTEGDNRAVLSSSLFPDYLFSEDVNGFEGEWWLLVGRDGVRVRYVPEKIIEIDQSHEGEQLRLVAARRNPASFVRAHARIFKEHEAFFRAYPEVDRARAVTAMKLALRAGDLRSLGSFAARFLRALVRGSLRRVEDKQQGDCDRDAVGEHAGDEHAEHAVGEEER